MVCSVINFLLAFLDDATCDSPASADKGVELSIGNGDGNGYWIPVAYYYQSLRRRPEIEIGTFKSDTSVIIRGFTVAATKIDGSLSASLEICGPELLAHSHIQLRWLETSRHPVRSPPPVDVWTLDNVTIEYINGSSINTLLHDTFDSQILK